MQKLNISRRSIFYLVCITLQYVHTALLEKLQSQNPGFTTSSMVNLSCFVVSGSKCTWVWDSVAEKSAAWKNCSVLWLLERSTWKDTLNIHGVHAWGKQESSSTSAIDCVQCDEHPSIQLCISAHLQIFETVQVKNSHQRWVLKSACSLLSSPLLAWVFRITVVCTKVPCVWLWHKWCLEMSLKRQYYH